MKHFTKPAGEAEWQVLRPSSEHVLVLLTLSYPSLMKRARDSLGLSRSSREAGWGAHVLYGGEAGRGQQHLGVS